MSLSLFYPFAAFTRRETDAVCAIVIEKGQLSYGAYVLDLPGCIAVGETIEEGRTLIQEAIEFHLEGLKEDGQ